MPPFAAIKPIWFVSLILIGSAEEARQHRLIETSQAITVGMTPDRVIEIMGQPDSSSKASDFWQLAFLGFNSGQMSWGSAVNMDAFFIPGSPEPNPFPIHLRLFSYAENDLVINFGFDDLVTEVRRPTLEVPSIAHGSLDAWLFVRRVALLLAAPDRG